MVTEKEAMQRHHDYYIQLERAGQLQEEDRAQYELAVQRGKAGEVDPLPQDRPTA